MEALLPSEISRLVLGFIEEQNCTEAAKVFLETCPHLKECAAAAQSGRKFGTQVYGKTLVNILDEYTLIHSIVQERIQELPENAALQLKSNCGNFLPDQVKHLLNGKSAGQRFHVNITVPTQVAVPQSNITSLGGLISNSSQCHQRSKSRIVGSSPASARPRRTTLLQEKRLTLRSQDSLDDVTASVTVQRVEATQLQNLTGTPERGNVAGDEEEENSSLLDPKTGEFISPCDKSHSVKNNSEGTKSVLVECGDTQSTNNLSKEVLCSDEAVKFGDEDQLIGRTSAGRTSLDKFVSDILACHQAEESGQKEVKHPSESVARADVTSETCVVSSQSVKVAITPSSKNAESHPSHFHQSPADKEAEKSVHESYLYTPKRSGAKRKAKPTPLKMITPLKSKAAPETMDSSEVGVDPKFFIGSLLDNRQLHEKIAENINQLIWPCGAEASSSSELAEVQPPEAAASLPLSTSGENVMHQELEKVIKTVVDKTEADPLFERLLNEILGPEYEEENSMLGDKSESETVLNAKTPEDKKGMTPMSLEDQNEEAINSILKAQPMEEDPKPSGGLCKNKVPSVKIVKGRPSGACKSIFSEVPGRGHGKILSGTNLPADHQDENRTQVNKLALVPIDNVMGPPLSFPRININGIMQYIVPVESLDSISFVRPIAPAGSNITPAPVNEFILRKATSEDLKNINSKPLVLPINSTDLTPIPTSSEKPSFFHLQLQNPVPFATSTPSTSATFLPLSNSIIEDNQNNTVLTIAVDGQPVADVNESESEANKTLKGPNTKKESTPTVLNQRPDRAVTEGRLPILEPPRATPLMTIGARRASLSTPRRSRSSGHVRALDFGSTPPTKQMLQDSQFAASNLSQEEPKHIRQTAASKTMRKDLQKVLDSSDKLPDPSTCIATRSPPPRLSKAWNKVGVDLIFGGTSPSELTSAPCSGQEAESEANDREVKNNKKNVSSEETCKWESPKLRLKGTWDADLRAIVSSAELKPKLTKKQQKEKERKEKALKRAEEAAKKKNAKQDVDKKEGEVIKGQKGKSEEEQENQTSKDKNPAEEKSTEEITSEDAKEEDNSVKKGKQKRRSKGKQVQKKKAAPKKSLEKIVPTIDTNDSHTSPEKTWVVQQSPGSLATKRSIHENMQNSLENESGKWPGSARKHLDLQETPRKSDLSITSLRRFCVGEDIHSMSACDRTTLTVVETPLFPMTPNINLLNTPNAQDSREFAETFPSYYKPSALEITEKESVPEETVISKCRQVDEDISQAANADGDSGKVNGSNIDDEVDVEEGSDISKKKNVKGKVSAKKKRQSCKAKKPVVRKSGKQVQTKNTRLSGKKEEVLVDEEVQQPERRVLRPRKSKMSYVEEPLEGEEKRNNKGKKEDSDEDYPLSTLQRKSSKCEYDIIDLGSSPEPLSKESPKIFDSVVLEEAEAQTKEAEILAKSISLKLSPLCPKTVPLEEEESDEESMVSDGSLIRTPKKGGSVPIVCSSSSSSSGSDSSSSSSYSSDISSDEDSKPHEKIPDSNEKSLNANQNINETPLALDVDVNISEVTKMPYSEPIKSTVSVIDSVPESFDKAQDVVNEIVTDAEKIFRNEEVQKSNFINQQKDKNSENEAASEKVNHQINAVGTSEHEKDKFRIEEEKRIGEKRSKKGGATADKLDKEKNVTKIRESIIIESRRLDDVKTRKDNLDKFLCLNKNKQDSPEKPEEVVLGIGGDSTSIMNPSFAELSMSNELEQKKKRTIDKLKGRAIVGGKFHLSVKTPLSQSQNLISPSKAEDGNSEANKSPKTMAESAVEVTQTHQSDPEQNKLVAEEEDEDCPTLRLSEGEDATSPCKILPSPRAFELLDSVEEKLAQIHAESRSPTMKKTARMSCSPHSSNKDSLQAQVKNVPEKSMSEVPCEKESTCSNQKLSKATNIEKKKTAWMEIEPIPSTSKASEKMHRAAERMLKAAERKLAKQNALSEGSTRSCHITFRKRNNFNETENKKTKKTLSVLQPCSSNLVNSDLIENKGIKKSTMLSESSEGFQERDRSNSEINAKSFDTREKSNHGVKETEDDEWSKRDSRRKKRSNLSDSPFDPIVPKEKQIASIVSKMVSSDSSELAKVSVEGKSHDLKAKSCLDKPNSDISKEIRTEDKGMHSSNASEKETKNKKNDNVIKSVKCTTKSSLFVKGVRSMNKSEAIDSSTPSHSDQLHTGVSKCDDSGAISGKTSEISKDVDIETNQKLSSPEVSNNHTRITKECLSERSEMDVESGVGKQREPPNFEEELSKGLECRKSVEEKISRSHKTLSRDSLGNSAKVEKGDHPSYSKQKGQPDNEKKEVQTSSSLVDNSSHRSESKKSEIINRTDKSDICEESSISMELREGKKSESGKEKDGFSSKFQSNTNVISENSALPNSYQSSERRSMIDEEQCNGLHSNNTDESLVPSSVTEISFELDEGVVRLTMSPYIEMLSYMSQERANEINKGASSERSIRSATPQVALRNKQIAFEERSSTRKRKHSNVFDSEVQRSKVGILTKATVKECSKKESNIRRNKGDESQIKKVLETLNNPSTGSVSVDDDSLFTYTVLGCIDSEETHAKEDEESERILPLKKRRTTTEDTPVKFQTDGVDGPHGNTGIISQLKTMEIEDFLSMVHGDGS